MHSFKTKFGSRQVERASQEAFDAVVAQASKCEPGKKLGAIFCQLQKDSSGRFVLTGTYLPPKWGDLINEVLQAHNKELRKRK